MIQPKGQVTQHATKFLDQGGETHDLKIVF